MKKLIYSIVAICLLFPVMTLAQTEKGKALVGVSSRIGLPFFGVSTGPDFMSLGFGTIKFKSDNHEDSESDKITGFNLTPRVGYFFANNFVTGLDLNLSFWSEKYGDSDRSNATVFSTGPFARLYFPTGKVKPFVEGYTYFGIYNSDDWDIKMSNNNFGGELGIAVPVGDKAAFDIGLVYNSNTLKDKEDNEDNYRTVVGTFGLRFSFVFLLGKEGK